MKITETIDSIEKRATKAGKEFVLAKLGDGNLASAFDADVMAEIYKHVGKAAVDMNVETNVAGFRTIRAIGGAGNWTERKVAPQAIIQALGNSREGNIMLCNSINNACAVFAAIAPKLMDEIGTDVIMDKAIKLVKQARIELEEAKS